MTTVMQQVVNGLMAGSVYAVVALGFALVFSVMRVLNMAHPDLAMVGAYVAYLIGTKAFPDQVGSLSAGSAIGVFALFLLAGMVVSGGAGAILERVVIRPTRGRYLLIPFIATAGVAIFLENGANRIFGANPVPVPSVLPYHVFNIAGVSFTAMQLATFVTAMVMMAAVHYYVSRSRWGLATRAVAESSDVAAGCGVDVNSVSRRTVVIASAMGGAAGVTIALLQTNAAPFMGLGLGLKAFVVMLVAGNRRIDGILIVGLMLGVLEAMVSGYLSSDLRDAVAFGLLLTILLFRPSGLFGSYPL
jgi:branched-chain amino acid transport system permease protein